MRSKEKQAPRLVPPQFTPPPELSGLPADTPILVAFSGGADSSSLLRMTVAWGEQVGCKVYAAHINHGIRGDEADRDEEFCRRISDELGVKLFVLNADVPSIAATRKESIETAARNVRYEFFDKVMRENGIPILATAHNAGDNLETMIFNMARGCALGGICGIPNSRPTDSGVLIRPILGMTRECILDYCRELDIPFVTDSTNADTDYTRNKIRNKIIPLIQEINPSAIENSVKLSQSLRSDALCLESMARWFLDEMREGDSVEAEKLCGSPEAIANRAIIEIHGGISRGASLEYTHIKAVRELAARAVPHSSIDLPGGVRASIENGRVVFLKDAPQKLPDADYMIMLSPGSNPISQTNCEIVMENSQKKINIYKKSILLYIDSAKICGSLYARPRQAGDKIRMGGMGKSLKKLLCDKKIPLDLRRRLPMICDEEGIVAVPLVGVCDRAKYRREHISEKTDNLPEGVICLHFYLN